MEILFSFDNESIAWYEIDNICEANNYFKGVVVVFLDAPRLFSWSFLTSARPISPKKS